MSIIDDLEREELAIRRLKHRKNYRHFRALKDTQQSFEAKVLEAVGTDYIVTGTYRGINNRVNMKHVTCGHEWPVFPHNFLVKGNRCPKCFGRGAIPLDTEQLRERIPKLTNGEYEIAGEYCPLSRRINIKHVTCGKVWNVFVKNFLYKGTRCPSCAKKRKANIKA
ncbi:MAG: hypothetical protein GX348_04915 [Veillonellaceae bacterium]|jgi:hypothetical protein|nr:hypothetical protein [Veillonellaceae bacterium]